MHFKADRLAFSLTLINCGCYLASDEM